MGSFGKGDEGPGGVGVMVWGRRVGGDTYRAESRFQVGEGEEVKGRCTQRRGMREAEADRKSPPLSGSMFFRF